MGTSNWQAIPFSVDVLMRIAPSRVLDIGVGYGRWGMLVHEFCDVWYSRIFQDQWKVEVVGVEAFPRSIAPYHKEFYSQIHIGDARELLPKLPGRWNAVIFGDVLEHFDKQTARTMLNTALDVSDYVLVNIPLGDDWPQDAMYENEYERHLSTWNAEEFSEFSLVRRHLMQDYIGRACGSFVLSREDPKDVRTHLYSPVHEYASLSGERTHAAAYGAHTGDALRAVDDLAAELTYIKKHSTYRVGAKLRNSGAWNALRWLKNRNDRVVTVRALGTHHPQAKGSEVWLLEASPNTGARCIPWEFVEIDNRWQRREVPERPYGQCVFSSGGMARVPVDRDPELKFLSHEWSGKVEIAFQGRREVIDLFSTGSGVVTVCPARAPMVLGAPDAPAQPVGPLTITPPSPVVPPHGHVNGAATAHTEGEQSFIDRFKAAGARVVAVTCPRWLGVTSSTRGLFQHVYNVPATRDEDPHVISSERLAHHAEVLLATGTDHVVLSGGDEHQIRLMRILKSRKPSLRVDLFFHGSYVQFCEDNTWSNFKLWVEAARKGEVHCLASDKWGWDEFCTSIGVRGAVLLNRVEGALMDPPVIAGDERQIGLWLSGSVYRKIPHAMLSAIRMMPNSRLHGAGLDKRALEVIEFLGIPVSVAQEQQFPHDELERRMRQTHLTMYVTFVECCPMLPLESLRLGVPALTGPNSHLFEDHPYLFSRLVVPFPDRAEVIARYAETALAEREQIISEYRKYHPIYDERCRRSVEALMRM